MLMVDRVETYDASAKQLVGIKNVPQNDLFLQGHFPEYPIFPGVLTLESLTQASTVLMHLSNLVPNGTSEAELKELLSTFQPPYSVLAESRIKYSTPIYPGDQIKLETRLVKQEGEIYTFKVRALVNAQDVAATGTVAVARTITGLVQHGALETITDSGVLSRDRKLRGNGRPDL